MRAPAGRNGRERLINPHTRIDPAVGIANGLPAQHSRDGGIRFAPRERRVIASARRYVCLGALTLAFVTPLRGQQPAALPAPLARFVSVNAPRVARTHARVIDGTGAPARLDQTVLLEGSRIGSSGPFASTPIPSDARILDLSGHTVIPGFVGLHEHT